MAMSAVSQELGRGGTEEEMVQPISVMRKRRCVAFRRVHSRGVVSVLDRRCGSDFGAGLQ